MSDDIELLPLRQRRSTSPDNPRTNIDAFQICRLQSAADRSAAFRLRHSAYASQGHIPMVDGAEYRDAHDDHPATVVFGAYGAGRLLGSMRLCFSLSNDHLSSLPCAPYYPALADLAAVSPNGLVEVSRLAIEPAIGNTSYRTTVYGFMVRSAFAAARAAGVSQIIVATRPDWVATYKHLLAFDQIGEPAPYPPGELAITLLAGNLEDAAKRAWMRNRFFRISDEDLAHMRSMLASIIDPARSTIPGAATPRAVSNN
jgi:N-acyl-L-homoserine lactone synthetase